VARVKKDGFYGYINSKNQTVIPFKFSNAKEFSGGYARVFDGKYWGFINKNGDLAIDYKFEKVSNFSRNRAVVQNNYSYGYIDTTGTIVIPCIYEKVNPFICELSSVENSDQIWIIDKNGKQIAGPYSDVHPFRQAEFDTVPYCSIKSEHYWLVIDKNQDTVWKEKICRKTEKSYPKKTIGNGLYLSLHPEKINISRERDEHKNVPNRPLVFDETLSNGENFQCIITPLLGENLHIATISENSNKTVGWKLVGMGGEIFYNNKKSNILPLVSLTPSYYKLIFFDTENEKTNNLEYRFYPIDPFH